VSEVSINAVPSIIPPYTDGSPGSTHPSSNQSNLLPPPNGTIDPDDALAGFLILETMSRGVALETAIKNVNELRKQKHAEWEKQKAALMEAMKAKENSSFWSKVGKICGTIGKIAAVVASVAVAFATGGAGAPLVLAVAGVCLSTAALAQGELHVLQKLGMSDKVAGYVEFGMAVASVACSFGASALKGAEAVTTFQKIMNTTARVAAIGSAGAGVAMGVATIEKGKSDGDAEDWYAEAAKARLEESRFEQLLLWVLGQLEDNEKEHRKTVDGVKDAIETRDKTLTIASGAA